MAAERWLRAAGCVSLVGVAFYLGMLQSISLVASVSLGLYVPTLPLAPFDIELNYSLYRHGNLPDQTAVLLYDSSVPYHVDTLKDVATANFWHHLNLFRCDCHTDPTPCTYFGHKNVREEVPPLLFFHEGHWSESYHDDMPPARMMIPQSRGQRVDAMLAWLDVAAERAHLKLQDSDRHDSKYAAIGRAMGDSLFQELEKMIAESSAKSEPRAEL